jgi:putative DNA methylase
VADSDYVKVEGCAGRMGQQMMAIACVRPGKQGKVYLSADGLPEFVPNDSVVRQRIECLCEQTGLTVPDEPLVSDAKDSCWAALYGLSSFGRLFAPRQLLCMLHLVAAARAVRGEDGVLAEDDGRGQALAVSIALAAAKFADFGSSLCTFNYTGGRGVKNTFSRQALPMVWDFAEANPFNDEIASWRSSLGEVVGNLRALVGPCPAVVQRGSATCLPWDDASFDAVLTDPPYYDNIPYAGISDFFYVWLKRSVGDLYPEHFAAPGTPKRGEAVADAVRHEGDRDRARQAYERMVREALAEAHRVLTPNGQLAVVYAHKTRVGWETLVEATGTAGFAVTEAWPLGTETSGRLRAQDAAALASSIFIAARKRETSLVASYEVAVRPELDSIVRERVDTLWSMGISGADLLIAAVGAGLRAFTRYARVEYENGEEVTTEAFLAEVEGVVQETLLERIFGVAKSGVGAVDAATRFYVLWQFTYRQAEVDAGEAIVFATPQAVELDGPRGLTHGKWALVEKGKDKYRLRGFEERGDNERLGLPDDDGAAAPLIDVLHRVLWLTEHRPMGLAEFLDAASPDTERLRLVADALAGPALEGSPDLGVTRTSERTALRKLVQNWRGLIQDNLFRKR